MPIPFSVPSKLIVLCFVYPLPVGEVANELAKLFIHKLADYKNKETYWLHESLPLYLEALALRNVWLLLFFCSCFLVKLCC